VFNREITKEEYNAIQIPKITLSFDRDERYSTRYQSAFIKAWALLSVEEKQKFYDIPHFNKDIFFEITGVDVDKSVTNEMTIKEIEERLGINNIKIVNDK
jgi:hypothetical protein